MNESMRFLIPNGGIESLKRIKPLETTGLVFVVGAGGSISTLYDYETRNNQGNINTRLLVGAFILAAAVSLSPHVAFGQDNNPPGAPEGATCRLSALSPAPGNHHPDEQYRCTRSLPNGDTEITDIYPNIRRAVQVRQGLQPGQPVVPGYQPRYPRGSQPQYRPGPDEDYRPSSFPIRGTQRRDNNQMENPYNPGTVRRIQHGQ